jgi:short-subunit dehydrogenase
MLLVARSEGALAEVAAACRAQGAVVETAALDVRDGPALAARVLAFDDAQPVDLVIANAGISAGRRPDGTWEGAEQVASQIAVNLLGAIHLVEPLLPRLRARRSGHVALVASVSGFRGLPDMRGYTASKAGLWSYGEALRAGLRSDGVTVTTIAPGFFESSMEARFLGPKPFAVSLETAAARIERGIRRRRPRIVFPLPLALTLRLLDMLPAALADPLTRVMRFRIAPEDGAPR